MRRSAPGKEGSAADVMPNHLVNAQMPDRASRNDVDHEHDELRLALQQILDIAPEERSVLAEEAMLEDFLRRLIGHHETENTLLMTRKPGNWQTHIELHAELISIARDILSKVGRDSYLDLSAIEGLLVLLERHVNTLDVTLFASIGE